MKQIGFKRVAEHIKRHQAFAAQLNVFISIHNNADSFEITDDVLNFMVHWLDNHILTDDKDYAAYAAQCA